MKFQQVRVVRVFLSEEGDEAERLPAEWHDRWEVHGITVYRGIAGFGDSRACTRRASSTCPAICR